jgi:hypothetical protein
MRTSRVCECVLLLQYLGQTGALTLLQRPSLLVLIPSLTSPEQLPWAIIWVLLQAWTWPAPILLTRIRPEGRTPHTWHG